MKPLPLLERAINGYSRPLLACLMNSVAVGCKELAYQGVGREYMYLSEIKCAGLLLLLGTDS